jgi:hypothetical protein
MAEVVQTAMKPYGYDVQICYNCNAADAPRMVSEARTPPPYKPDPAVPEILASRNAPGLGAVDFGAVAIQFLRSACRGTGPYAKEKPRTNLRLIANIQDPSYVLAAANRPALRTCRRSARSAGRSESSPRGIGSDSTRILAHFGLSREAIEASGGRIGNTPENRENFERCDRWRRRYVDCPGMENLDGDQSEIRPQLYRVAGRSASGTGSGGRTRPRHHPRRAIPRHRAADPNGGAHGYQRAIVPVALFRGVDRPIPR